MSATEVSWATAQALLQRYDTDGDPADLDAAIASLLDTAGDLEHPEPITCHWLLSCAYGERGRRDDRIGDLDEAITWARRLVEGISFEDPDTDELIVHLADLYWDRSWSLRYGGGAPPEDTGDLVGALAGLRLSGAHPVAGHYVRLLLGAAHLDGYDNTEDPADRRGLDVGLADAGPAMAALMLHDADTVAEWVGDGQLALLGGLLGHAYTLRFDLDGDPGDLDRAVVLLTESVGRGGAASYLRDAYRRRWETRREPGDLDAAVAAGESILTQPSGEIDRFAAFNLAELLAERAGEREQQVDARRAAALFEQVAVATDDILPWYRAYEASLLLWRLITEPAALNAAAGQLDRALALGPEPGYDLLTAHTARLDIERSRTEAGLAPLDPDRPGQSAFRDLLEAAHRAFAGSPGIDPELRARTAFSLAAAEMSVVAHDLGAYRAERIRAMLSTAAATDLGELWRAGIDIGFGQLDLIESMDDARLGADAVRRFASAVEHLDGELLSIGQLLLAVAMDFKAGAVGDLHSAHVGRAELLRRAGAGAVLEPLLEVYLRLEPLLQDGDLAAIARLIAEASPIIEATTPGTSDGYLADFIRLIRATADPEWGWPDSATFLPAAPAAAASMPGHHGTMQQVLRSTAAGALHARGVATGDLRLVRQAAEHNDAVFADAPAGDRRMRLGAAAGAGLMYLDLARRSAAPHAVAVQAVDRFTSAMELAVDHQHPRWPMLAMHCAEAIRLTADPDLARSRRLGWSALRAHAWQVFAQTGTEHALAAARTASEHARTVGTWCVQDGTVEDLVGVLDAGRALVLRAATTSRSVADRLLEAGRPDLAAAWHETSGLGRNRLTGAALAAAPSDDALVVPDGLRFEVLAALGGEGEVVGLRPVTVAEIQAALVAGAVDALVHLVPGEGSQPGLAVVVPARGDCTVLRLAQLRADEGSPLAGFAASAGTVRDLAAAGVAAAGRSLDAVCAWAWTAAMAEVLAAVGGTAGRLVLLPFGVLSVVPWHAACSWHGGRRRYLVEDTVVGYSPSARMFCDGTPFAAAPIRSALVVGNPGDDLAFAGIEARAIHRAFYPDGAYFGPGGARPGTPGDVLDWIGAAPAGLTVLHFACHAAIDADRPTEAHLILSGGATLSADTLLHRSRTAALDIEQVFLAACTTSGTRSVHDEVLSLASTFLTAGARTVVGSLWPAPDAETSLLMFMVHRYLRVDGCAPAEALRRAQVWMLAADREVPADLPAELRAQCRPGTGFDLAAWAGFIHFGR